MKTLCYILCLSLITIALNTQDAFSQDTRMQPDGIVAELDNSCEIEVGFDYEVENLQVKFFNTSDGNYDLIEWEFGEGERKSTEQDPEHLYESEGAYTFCLTATNTKEGCSEKFCGQLYVFK